jgi:hypothetical protein
MMHVQKKYIQKFDEVDSFFVQMRENQENNIELEENMIFVKGKESMLNILYKTIESIEYLFCKKKYDYLVRSNISTIVNIPNLLTKLNSFPSNNIYSGCYTSKLNWLDTQGGITDEKLFGTEFVAGMAIILSYDLVNFLVEKKDKLDYNIIDDVSIGSFVRDYCIDALEIGKKNLVDIIFLDSNNVKQLEYNYNKFVFFRNRNGNRDDDLKNMDNICHFVYNTPLTFTS